MLQERDRTRKANSRDRSTCQDEREGFVECTYTPLNELDDFDSTVSFLKGILRVALLFSSILYQGQDHSTS